MPYSWVAKAGLLLHDRFDLDDGSIIEMAIWRVPTPVPPTTHGFKYSLFYGRPGVRQIGYDNERGKGDHRHVLDRESPYGFTTVDRLIEDFWADVNDLRGRL